MLAFLDSLCGALLSRDTERIRALLAHPLARALPLAVREEADAIAGGTRRGYIAPLEALRFYHQTTHLLGLCADPASRQVRPAAPPSQRRQLELALEPASTR